MGDTYSVKPGSFTAQWYKKR